MSDNDCGAQSRSASENTTTDAEQTIAVDELLAGLAEEYTKEILAALDEESAATRKIVESTGASRPTVYRCLNQLEAIGAVETAMVSSPDRQHRREF